MMFFQAIEPASFQSLRDISVGIGVGVTGVAASIRLLLPIFGSAKKSSNGHGAGFEANMSASITSLLAALKDIGTEGRASRNAMSGEVRDIREKLIQIRAHLDTMPTREVLQTALADSRRQLYEHIDECCERRKEPR